MKRTELASRLIGHQGCAARSELRVDTDSERIRGNLEPVKVSAGSVLHLRSPVPKDGVARLGQVRDPEGVGSEGRKNGSLSDGMIVMQLSL
jgi:hypothetical protein